MVGCLSQNSGRLSLTDDDGDVYHLRGQTAGLQKHVGDELRLRGIQAHPPTPPTQYSLPETTLNVTHTDVMVRRNRAGVRPVISALDTWLSHADPAYGVRFRYPATFEKAVEQDPHVEANFAGQEWAASTLILNLQIPQDTYPNSNYVDGGFTALLNPNIRSEATCSQFRSFWPEHTFSTTIHGIKYSQTFFTGVATGTTSTVYYFHTLQNGLCYEFDVVYNEENGTGIGLPCSMQWVSHSNELALMNAVLSQVSFLTPQFKPARSQRLSKNRHPSVVAFEHGAVKVDRGITTFDLSWRTKDADYVQLRYRCVKSLLVSVINAKGDLQCSGANDSNFPPDASASLMPGNFSSAPVQFVVTIEPFLDGVGYPGQSKTLSISVAPHPPVGLKSQKPVAP